MPKRSTKQRILDASLALFNHLGTASTSTNHIALELDISPGNLYYHYPNKEQLITTLFSRYEAGIQPLFNQNLTLDSDIDDISIEDIWFFLHLNFELALEYRFIYQDTDYITLKCPALAKSFQQVLSKLYTALTQLLSALSSNRVLDIPCDVIIEEIGLNMLLICTQWIHLKKHLAGIDTAKINEEHFNRGIYQALSLLTPYLNEAHQAHLQALRRAYQ